MAQLVTTTVEVRGVASAKLLVRIAGPLAMLVSLVSPRTSDALLVGIAGLVPKLIRCKAI